jgi:uncharacterized membrane protein
VLGLIAWWPRGDAPDLNQPTRFVDATVRSVTTTGCDDPEAGDTGADVPCRILAVELTSGSARGRQVDVRVLARDGGVADVDQGDKVVLHDNPSAPAEFRYSFADHQRATPLWWLLGGFVLAVVVIGRWPGVRALAGLAFALVVLAAFLVPALLRDHPAVPVVLVAGAVIGFVALYLAHGFNIGTTIAVAGTLVSLAITAGLALLAVEASRLTALGDTATTALRVPDALDLRGLLVAGIVVGALGVLDDVTVSQVSIVASLRRANPGLRGRLLYREATTVGRDHMASTVNTLVLAYAGASLPLLLLMAGGGAPLGRVLTSEVVAVEVVRMLVGAIGLILAVPVTTALAAAVLAPGGGSEAHSYGRIGRDPIADGGGIEGPAPAHASATTGRIRARRRRSATADEDDLAPAEEI